MPMYSYKCPECGHRQVETKPMSKSDMAENCVNCCEITTRDFSADLFHTASDRYDKPIISDSLAISMDQIAEHKAQFPDIDVTPQGQLVFDKFSKHEKYLKDTGHVKHPGTSRRRTKKVATATATE